MTAAAPKRARNARGQGERLKDELVDAAMRLLDRSPSTALSLRLVAREAGIAPPSVYRQYDDAQSMMTEIVTECWRQMGEAMENAAARGRGGSALERLNARMTGFVHYAMDRPSRYNLLFATQPIDPQAGVALPGPLVPAYRSVERSMEEIMAEGGKLPMRDVQSSALLIIASSHGRIALARLAPNRPGNSAKEVARFVSEVLATLFAPADVQVAALPRS
jgi:AcrR family transcriptional regulator